MADSDDLINQAIVARQNIEAQRLTLISRLRSTPSGRRGSRAAMAIQDEIHGLDRQASEMDREIAREHVELDRRHTEELRNTSDAHRLAQKQQDVETTRQAGEVFLRGQEIFNKYKPGDPRINDEMGKLRDQFPLGFDTMAVKGHFGKLAASHDKESERIQGKLADTLFKQIGASPEQFSQAKRIRGINVSGKLPDVIDEKFITEGQKGAGKRGEKANYIAADIAGQTHIFPRALFENLSSHFMQQPGQAIKSIATQPEDIQEFRTPPPKGINYVLSGTQQPLHGGDYWTEQLPNEMVRRNFASGGSSVTGRPTQEAQDLTAARSKFLSQNQAGTTGVVGQPPADISPVGGLTTGTPVTDQLTKSGVVSTTPGVLAGQTPAQQPVASQPAPKPEVKHLGIYNPATGNFE